MLLVAGEAEADRLVVEPGAGVEVERVAGPGEPQAVRHVARAADHQPLLVDRDAGGPAARLAERLLLPVAGRLAVLQLLQGHAERALPVDRIGIDDPDVLALDRDHRVDVVGREHGLAGQQRDEAAGGDLAGSTVVHLDRDLRPDEAGEREQAAGLAVLVQGLLVLPVPQQPAGHAVADQLLGRYRRMAEQEAVAPARDAQVRQLGRSPEGVGDGVDHDPAAQDVEPVGAEGQELAAARTLEGGEAQRPGQRRDQAQAGPAAHAAGGMDDDVAQPGRAVLLRLEVEPAAQQRIELARR